ncbi:uncharacterized protein G2W53_032584 [Senna tora]|uniref:Uncharacterized protein n=1 Tax=Senna tora TaxID=362788 RepID=A0A834W7T2_9FABA|nr:uncharacterized protein G2W53_032584 [Senna tora]
MGIFENYSQISTSANIISRSVKGTSGKHENRSRAVESNVPFQRHKLYSILKQLHLADRPSQSPQLRQFLSTTPAATPWTSKATLTLPVRANTPTMISGSSFARSSMSCGTSTLPKSLAGEMESTETWETTIKKGPPRLAPPCITMKRAT